MEFLPNGVNINYTLFVGIPSVAIVILIALHQALTRKIRDDRDIYHRESLHKTQEIDRLTRERNSYKNSKEKLSEQRDKFSIKIQKMELEHVENLQQKHLEAVKACDAAEQVKIRELAEQKNHFEQIMKQYGHNPEWVVSEHVFEGLYAIRLTSLNPKTTCRLNGSVYMVHPSIRQGTQEIEILADPTKGPYVKKETKCEDNPTWKEVMEALKK